MSIPRGSVSTRLWTFTFLAWLQIICLHHGEVTGMQLSLNSNETKINGTNGTQTGNQILPKYPISHSEFKKTKRLPYQINLTGSRGSQLKTIKHLRGPSLKNATFPLNVASIKKADLNSPTHAFKKSHLSIRPFSKVSSFPVDNEKINKKLKEKIIHSSKKNSVSIKSILNNKPTPGFISQMEYFENPPIPASTHWPWQSARGFKTRPRNNGRQHPQEVVARPETTEQKTLRERTMKRAAFEWLARSQYYHNIVNSRLFKLADVKSKLLKPSAKKSSRSIRQVVIGSRLLRSPVAKSRLPRSASAVVGRSPVMPTSTPSGQGRVLFQSSSSSSSSTTDLYHSTTQAFTVEDNLSLIIGLSVAGGFLLFALLGMILYGKITGNYGPLRACYECCECICCGFLGK